MPRLAATLAIGLAVYAVALVPYHSAAASDRDLVYAPPTGLALLPSDHSGRVYGATGAGANWVVAQWGIPEDLPGFDAKGTATDRAASVSFSGGTITLRENTRGSSCDHVYSTGRKQVREFDLFLQPHKKGRRDMTSAVRNVSRRVSELSQVVGSITVEPVRLDALDTTCRITKVGLLTAIVLTNPTAKQTFFYQLRLGQYRLRGTTLVSSLPPPGWYFTGENTQNGRTGEFGFGDDVTLLGSQAAVLGQAATYRINLLPRLRALLAVGIRYGMDQDTHHWVLSGTYFGTNAFGHVDINTRWSDFSLTAH